MKNTTKIDLNTQEHICSNCKNLHISTITEEYTCYSVYDETTVPITLKCNSCPKKILNPKSETCLGFKKIDEYQNSLRIDLLDKINSQRIKLNKGKIINKFV